MFQSTPLAGRIWKRLRLSKIHYIPMNGEVSNQREIPMKLVTKPLLNVVALVVAAGSMIVSAPALSAPPSASANASRLSAGHPGTANGLHHAPRHGAARALERLSDMKIRHAVLTESLQNIQIEAHIKEIEKKMNGSQGVSSARVPVVSLLTCSAGAGQAVSHCAATLSLPNGTRIPAYPGTVIGNGMKLVGITAHGVLAADGSSRFYLPFSGGVSSPLQDVAPRAGLQTAGFGSQRSANALPPPVLGGAMNTITPPAGMLPAGMH